MIIIIVIIIVVVVVVVSWYRLPTYSYAQTYLASGWAHPRTIDNNNNDDNNDNNMI